MDYEKPYVVTGATPGKNVVILAGVHGNEVCGIQTFENLLPSLHIDKGTATFLFANPRAIQEGKRFIERNLNRMFRPDADLSEEERVSYEYIRSRELIPYLEAADALLDIHSSPTLESTPFIICEKRSLPLAGLFPVPIISSGWDRIHPGSTDSFMNSRDRLAICIECGYHNDPNAIDRATKAIQIFLEATGCIEKKSDEAATEKQQVEVSFAYIVKEHFIPVRVFADFEPVKAGELLGHDGEETIEAPADGVIIFADDSPKLRSEGFLFGTLSV